VIQNPFTETWILLVLVYIIVTISLNLEAGFTGIPNFGKAVFVFMGAWAAQGIGIRLAAYLLEKTDPGLAAEALKHLQEIGIGTYKSLVQAAGDTDANRIVVTSYIYPYFQHHLALAALLFTAVLAIALALSAAMGLFASFAAVRLREEYLAILLLSFSELMVMVIFQQTTSLNGGPQGIWAMRFGSNGLRTALILAAVFAAITFLYAEKLANSPMGRAMRAVRDDEIAAGVYGRDVARIRLKVIMVSSMIAALAGLAFIQATPSTVSMGFDRVKWTFFPWAYLILGGMANNVGAVLGTVIFLILQRLVQLLPVYISGTSTTIMTIIPYLSNILVGVIIILVLYFRPQGILPEKPSKTVDFHRILVEEGE